MKNYIRLFNMTTIIVLFFGGCNTFGLDSNRVNIRVEVIKFSEDAIHYQHMDGPDSWTSVIELKIINPKEYRGLCLVEHWRGVKAGEDFTTIGNVFDAMADSRLFDKKNIGNDGKIHCYTLPYVGLERFKIVTKTNKKAEPTVSF